MATKIEFSLDDVRDALDYVDANVRDTWIQMGMAIRSEFGDAGFDAWDQWSQSGHGYKPATARSVWKSFKKAGVGLGTLIQQAKNAGYQPKKRSKEEQAKLNKLAVERRKQVEVKLEQERIEDAAFANHTRQLVEQLWQCFVTKGESAYLKAKKVKPHGVRFADYGMVLVYSDHVDKPHDLIWGPDNISAFFDSPDRETRKFLYIKRGTLVIPMRDVTNELLSLQLIFEGGSKKFLKYGQKSGCFHLIGEVISRDTQLGIAEGYATAATLHQIMGMPMAVAFDAGNLMPVAKALRERYPNNPIVIFGDDDRETEGNPGRTKALAAAEAVQGKAVFPELQEAG